MTARPDVPDAPDRTDAIARVLMAFEEAHEEADAQAWPEADDYAHAILTTDDPAAIAALLAEWWERHPEAVLAAGVNAGHLVQDHKDVCSDCGVDHGDMHPRACAIARGERVLWNPMRRLATVWREATP